MLTIVSYFLILNYAVVCYLICCDTDERAYVIQLGVLI